MGKLKRIQELQDEIEQAIISDYEKVRPNRVRKNLPIRKKPELSLFRKAANENYVWGYSVREER